MAVPKGKVSKARRDKRRANWKLAIPLFGFRAKENRQPTNGEVRDCGTVTRKGLQIGQNHTVIQ